MLTVWCVLNGTKYTDNDVYILRDMVSRHLSVEHQFSCLADRQIPGVYTVISTKNWAGWWMKLELFYQTGKNLYLDLDTVVTGSLDDLVVDHGLSMPSNWAQSGHGGCQSSVIAWCGDYSDIPDQFYPVFLTNPENGNFGWYEIDGARCWGDQEFITHLMGNPGDGDVMPMSGIKSYKYHCKNGLPGTAKVVCFHGEPKPAQVRDEWVRAARSTPIPA